LTLRSNLILNFNFWKISHQHAPVNEKVPGANFKFRGFEGWRVGVILNEIRVLAATPFFTRWIHEVRDGNGTGVGTELL